MTSDEVVVISPATSSFQGPVVPVGLETHPLPLANCHSWPMESLRENPKTWLIERLHPRCFFSKKTLPIFQSTRKRDSLLNFEPSGVYVNGLHPLDSTLAAWVGVSTSASGVEVLDDKGSGGTGRGRKGRLPWGCAPCNKLAVKLYSRDPKHLPTFCDPFSAF